MLRAYLAVLALLTTVSYAGLASAQTAVGTLTGVITDAAGKPLAGAFVEMKNAERRLNFMVITQEQGQYAIDRLPPGKYVVQAIGGEHQSTPSNPVEVAVAKPLTGDEEKVLLAYLSTNYGPAPGSARAKPDPFSRLPRTLLPPEARNYVIVEYELANPRAEPHEVAADAEGNGWVSQRVGGRVGRLDPKTLTYLEYEPPAGNSSTVRLNGIRRGNHGELWMVDGGPNRRWLSFDPKYERFTVYNVPPTRSGGASGNTMRVLPDDSVWLAAIGSNQVIRFDPATKKFTIYDVPAGIKNNRNATPYGMAVDGDENVWVVENAFDQIARINRVTGKFDEFPLSVKDPVARKLGADWDGNLWVGLHGAGKLLRVDYKTLKMTEFTPPTKDAGVYLAEPDLKNHLIWTTEQQVDQLARLDPATGNWTEYPLMTAETDVRRIDLDPTNPNRVWYSGVLSSRIGYMELLQ